MLRLLFAVLVLALVIPNYTQAETLTAKQIFAFASPSVVKIKTKRGAKSIQGSGVVLSRPGDDSYVITNAHVAGGADEVTVIVKGIQITGKIIASSEHRDLAVILIKSVKLEGAKYLSAKDDQAAEVGDRVYAIGSPSGLTNTLSEGLVSGLRQRDGVSLIQTTASISPGSSGGGLFNKYGKLIGITTFKIAKGENLNFAIDVRQVDALISGEASERNKTDTVQEKEAKANQEMEAEANLTRIHSDWYEVVNSAGFRKWMTTLPTDEQDKLNQSWDWRFISQKITQYKKSQFRLICQMRDYKGNPDERSYEINETAQTVNGRSAYIDATKITQKLVTSSGAVFNMSISRLSGLITVDDDRYGRAMDGKCKRFSGTDKSAF